jgi:hypothetical protein
MGDSFLPLQEWLPDVLFQPLAAISASAILEKVNKRLRVKVETDAISRNLWYIFFLQGHRILPTVKGQAAETAADRGYRTHPTPRSLMPRSAATFCRPERRA